MRSSASNQTHQQKQKPQKNELRIAKGIMDCWNNGKTPFSRGDISGHIVKIERPFARAEYSSSSASGNSLAYPSPRHSILPLFQHSRFPSFLLPSFPTIPSFQSPNIPDFVLRFFHHSIFPLFQYSRFSSSILHAQKRATAFFRPWPSLGGKTGICLFHRYR